MSRSINFIDGCSFTHNTAKYGCGESGGLIINMSLTHSYCNFTNNTGCLTCRITSQAWPDPYMNKGSDHTYRITRWLEMHMCLTEIKPSTSNIVADCIFNNDSHDYEGPGGLDNTLIRAA